MYRFKLIILVLLFAASFGFIQASAQIKNVFTYQGRLTLSGNPDKADLTFKIYNAENDLLWQEARQDVPLNNGVFSVLLGENVNNPVSTQIFTENDGLEIGVGVNGSDELTPRAKITRVAYSIQAEIAEHVAPGAIDSAALAANAVTSDKIAPNIISSLNNIANDGGNIDLKGRGNILIEADADSNAIFFEVSVDSVGDNLGNHRAAKNLNLNGNWLSGDGDREGVFVTSDGDVGIGTTSPTNAALGIQRRDGMAGISLTNKARSWMIMSDDDPDQFKIKDETQSETRFRIDNAGRVAIGNAGPEEKLHVEGVIYSSDGGFKFPDGSVQATAATGGMSPGLSNTARVDEFVYIVNSWREVAKTVINVPGDGFVMVTATAEAGFFAITNNALAMVYQIREKKEPRTTTGNPSAHLLGFVDGKAPITKTFFTAFSQRIFEVKKNKEYTFIFEAIEREQKGANEMGLSDPQITALFIPVAYGTVN